MLNDAQIVAEVLAGKIGEFRKLVHQHQQPVFRFACNLIGDAHDAEDIAQEVFLAAYDHLESYDTKRAKMLTWLFTMTRNKCLNYLKRSRPALTGDAIPAAKHTVQSDETARLEFWSRLDEALNALPIEQKTAFVLAEIEGLPYADIAHIEQTTLGTVKSRIHRAKQRLRAVLAPTLGEP